MTAELLDGKAFLELTIERLRERVAALVERGITPGLGTILVGDDPNSHAYVRGKREACGQVGIISHHRELAADISPSHLHAEITAFNEDPAVDGFIVQLPLPDQLDEEAALLAIDADKDADGLHPVNLGRLVMGVDAPRPCTPARHPGAPRAPPGADRGQARRHRRARAHDRATARAAARTEAGARQRGGHRGAHRRRRSRRATPARPTSSWRPPARRRSSRPTW